jgi:hypothetical protein
LISLNEVCDELGFDYISCDLMYLRSMVVLSTLGLLICRRSTEMDLGSLLVAEKLALL